VLTVHRQTHHSLVSEIFSNHKQLIPKVIPFFKIKSSGQEEAAIQFPCFSTVSTTVYAPQGDKYVVEV
jgi:hypothetical protein